MRSPTSEFAIVPVERLDVAFSSQRWPFADERRSEIDAYWAELQRQNPGLWNGRVLMLGDFAIADGAFLLGVMGAHTFNAGQIYFPCGTLDLNDIAADQVDFEYSIRREVAEETGLDVGEFAAEPGWNTVLGGSLVAHMKLLRARQTAAELRARILDHLASEAVPELSDIRVVRSEADFDPMMPTFVTVFLRHIWSRVL